MKHRKGSPKELISCNLHLKGNLDQWEEPYFDYLLTMYNQYNKHGHLPFEGSLTNQPAKIVEYFELFNQLDMERQDKIRKEEERKQAKQSRNRRK